MSFFTSFIEKHPIRMRFIDFSSGESKKKPKKKLLFCQNGYAAKLICVTLTNSGFKEVKDVEKSSVIVGEPMGKDKAAKLKLIQKFNHYVYTYSLGTKKGYHKIMTDFKNRYNFLPYFYPETYLMPTERSQLMKAFPTSALWIQKPASGSRGIGIKVISKFPSKVKQLSQKTVVQKYIMNPILINSLKFDLRFYVAVTSLDPLMIFLFDNGLVRFATSPYEENLANIGNRGAHLTNYSVNKNKKEFIQTNDLDDDGQGSKWSHHPFWPHLEANEGLTKDEIDLIRNNIEDSIATIILAAHRSLKIQKNHFCSFELFGIDVLIDKEKNVKILEINVSPAMGTGSELDKSIKSPLMKDFFNISLIPHKTKVNRRISKLMIFDHSKENLPIKEFISICRFESSLQRLGGFKMIYPTTDRCTRLQRYSESISDLDLCVAQWMLKNDDEKHLYLDERFKLYEKFIKTKKL